MIKSAAQKLPSPRPQYTAASPDHSIWVNASAGTGKTNILTQRVLGLLLHGVKPERILCLTYTKAAAAEMAARIRLRLGKWVAIDDAALFADVESIIGDDVTDKMLSRARLLFAQCLDTPDGLKIQTIHGFCQSVLQRFPLESGLLPRFQVCEEREAAKLLHQAMHHVLRRPDKEPELRGAIELLSEIISQEIQLESLLSIIIGKRNWLFQSLARHESIESMLKQAAELSGISGPLSKDAFMAQICADKSIAISNLRAACSALMDGTDAESRRGIETQRWLDAKPDTRIKNWPEYADIFLTADGEIRAKIINPKTAEKYPHALSAIQNEAARIIAARNTLKTLDLLVYNHAALILAMEIFTEYNAAKSRIGALDYDDLIQYTLRLLQKPGIAPWILFKLDGGIDHLLIDEAQDTSPDQWHIVRLLTEEFFAGTGAKGRPTSVFAVGDPKQSIYSFQHADPRGFTAMQNHYTKAAFEIRQTLQVIPLQYSYRSTIDVLRIVDSVFTVTDAKRGVSFFTSAEEQKKLLQNQALIEHIAMRDEAPGIVEIWPLAQDSEKQKIRPWHIPDARQEAFSAAEKMAGAIAHTIEQWLQDGEMLPGNIYTKREARKIQPGDIMILVRRRNEFVDLLTRALKNKNIPVAGVDRLVLSEHIAIMDLLALAKFLLLPEDDLNLATVLKSPLLSLPPDRIEELLFDLCAARGQKSVWQRLRETGNTDLQKAHEYLAELLDRYSFLSPFELFSDILNRLGGRKKLIARMGVECIDPIDEFLNLCAGPAQNMHLQEFVAFMVNDTVEIKRDLEAGERGEVRIMTVHASKGLQAPIVFLPDTTRLPKPKSTVAELLFDEKEQILLWPAKREWLQGYAQKLRDRADQATSEEYRRLLYVALTRAEDRLYIGGYGAAEPESWYSYIAQAAYDMTQNDAAKTTDFDFAAHGFADWQGSGWRIGHLPKVKIHLPEEDKIKSISLPGWLHRPAPSDPTPPKPLSPSKPAAEPASISPTAQNGARGMGILRGKIIHRLLQSLPDIDPEKRGAAMQNFIKPYVVQIGAAEAEEIIAEIKTLFDQPEFAEYFGPTSRAEVPVSGKIGDKIIMGQIDRLSITQETIKILDFKTNRPPPTDPANTPEVYLRQMAAYTALLEKIYPQHRVEAALLWTNIAKLMPLPAAILARYKP
jgi:ATP-dependent helicase/nuclease subunit A